MKDYNKIIEALSVRFIKVLRAGMLHPVQVTHQHDLENRLILVQNGTLYFDEGQGAVKPGQMLFVPSGGNFTITYQGTHTDTEPIELSQDALVKYPDSYFDTSGDDFISLLFDVKAFGSLDFFRSLGISYFVFENEAIAERIRQIIREAVGQGIGWERVNQTYSDQIMMLLLRHFNDHRLFVEEFATNLAYFHDPRLIKLFVYIRENLSNDLSNRRLAEVAEVSEDYVGQYFKMLTGINPQDYIEYQRMEQAVDLLRKSKKAIREISHAVGYQDTAYFCRRFKMMFGIPAGKMRKRESLLKN